MFLFLFLQWRGMQLGKDERQIEVRQMGVWRGGGDVWYGLSTELC